ncbi:MAG: hypothetical protein GY822_02380 [Deltaproteobacteria bacterium]|nr:hypothetical protein [Deltaproteobacteria bacterium]
MEYQKLAGILDNLASEYDVKLGTLAMLGCGTGSLEVLGQDAKPGKLSSRYLVVSEDTLKGSSIAWMDSLAPRNGYDARKVARAMAKIVYDDGIRQDSISGHRMPQVTAVVDLEKVPALLDAARAFSAAAARSSPS